MTSALIEFKAVMAKQAESLPPLPSTAIPRFAMKLSDRECADLCQSPSATCEQMVTSKHVMVKSDDYVYKIIYCPLEIESYLQYMNMITGTPVHLIVPQVVKWQRPIVLKCKYAFYSPLSVSEAKYCLWSLIAGIREALDELHSFGLSHNDVRLPNICFNSSYQVVLIDMDRCYQCDEYHPIFGSSSSSCMYTLLPSSSLEDRKMTDFFQLAWLVMWVLDHSSENYHEREWDSQKEEIKDDEFIHTLVMKGKYDPYLLQNSTIVTETTTLENVLQQRGLR